MTRRLTSACAVPLFVFAFLCGASASTQSKDDATKERTAKQLFDVLAAMAAGQKQSADTWENVLKRFGLTRLTPEGQSFLGVRSIWRSVSDVAVSAMIFTDDTGDALEISYVLPEPIRVHDSIVSYLLARAEQTTIEDKTILKIRHPPNNGPPAARCHENDSTYITFDGALIKWSTTFICVKEKNR